MSHVAAIHRIRYLGNRKHAVSEPEGRVFSPKDSEATAKNNRKDRITLTEQMIFFSVSLHCI